MTRPGRAPSAKSSPPENASWIRKRRSPTSEEEPGAWNPRTSKNSAWEYSKRQNALLRALRESVAAESDFPVDTTEEPFTQLICTLIYLQNFSPKLTLYLICLLHNILYFYTFIIPLFAQLQAPELTGLYTWFVYHNVIILYAQCTIVFIIPLFVLCFCYFFSYFYNKIELINTNCSSCDSCHFRSMRVEWQYRDLYLV